MPLSETPYENLLRTLLIWDVLFDVFFSCVQDFYSPLRPLRSFYV